MLCSPEAFVLALFPATICTGVCHNCLILTIDKPQCLWYAFFMIKNITRVELLYQQSKLRAKLNRQQDLKNNPELKSDYFKPANNNHKLYELGCVPVNMQTQPYQPIVVKHTIRSK